MKKALLAAVAVVGLAAAPVMAQTMPNSDTTVKSKTTTTNPSMKSDSTVNHSTTTTRTDRDGDKSVSQKSTTRKSKDGMTSEKSTIKNRSQATVPSDMNHGSDNSAKDYAPGQMKK